MYLCFTEQLALLLLPFLFVLLWLVAVPVSVVVDVVAWLLLGMRCSFILFAEAHSAPFVHAQHLHMFAPERLVFARRGFGDRDAFSADPSLTRPKVLSRLSVCLPLSVSLSLSLSLSLPPLFPTYY
jgi:hypothetical protein